MSNMQKHNWRLGSKQNQDNVCMSLILIQRKKDTKPKVNPKKGEVRFTEFLAVIFSPLTQCGERIERSMCWIVGCCRMWKRIIVLLKPGCSTMEPFRADKRFCSHPRKARYRWQKPTPAARGNLFKICRKSQKSNVTNSELHDEDSNPMPGICDKINLWFNDRRWLLIQFKIFPLFRFLISLKCGKCDGRASH